MNNENTTNKLGRASFDKFRVQRGPKGTYGFSFVAK